MQLLRVIYVDSYTTTSINTGSRRGWYSYRPRLNDLLLGYSKVERDWTPYGFWFVAPVELVLSNDFVFRVFTSKRFKDPTKYLGSLHAKYLEAIPFKEMLNVRKKVTQKAAKEKFL